MKLRFLLFTLLWTSLGLNAQISPIKIYDLELNTVDSLPIIPFDTLITEDKTDFFVGDYNNDVAFLEESEPLENLFPNTRFTYKAPVAQNYDVTQYPFRTTIKLYFNQSDSINQRCTGNMVGPQHVLTAAHCVLGFGIDSLNSDTYWASPAFDNGLVSNTLPTARVRKIYALSNYSIGTSDFALLELEHPIGNTTGWIGMGFNLADSLLRDSIYHKFSYPGTTLLTIDSNTYNGDTLYHSYGVADWVFNQSIGVVNGGGIPGESGSSLIKIRNGKEYTSYGILKLSFNMNHGRIPPYIFYSFKDIIENNSPTNVPTLPTEDFQLYPNPVSDILYIKTPYPVLRVKVFSLLGQEVSSFADYSLDKGLNLSFLPPGYYGLHVLTPKGRGVIPVIKQ